MGGRSNGRQQWLLSVSNPYNSWSHGLEFPIRYPHGAIEGVVLPEDTVSQLMRIVQEAVTNAVKHANASHITVNARLVEALLHLEVCDNGKGLPNMDSTASSTQRGLRHIAHRANAIGAQWSVRSLAAPAHGVCVRVSLPVLV